MPEGRCACSDGDKDAAAAIARAVEAVPALAGGTATALTGGISNTMYLVSAPAAAASEQDGALLVRFYGVGLPLCERASEEELVRKLSAAGVGAGICSTFGHGRVEQFLKNRRPVLPSEVLDLAAMIAPKVAQLHNLSLNLPGRAPAEQQLARWLAACPAHTPTVDMVALQAEVAGVSSLRPVAVLPQEKTIERVLLERRLCHLDLFASNLLYSEAERDVVLIVIANLLLEPRTAYSRVAPGLPLRASGPPASSAQDFEYAAEAPCGLDLANHFSGATELIEGATVTFDTRLYPAPEAQRRFLDAYLTARGLPRPAGHGDAYHFAMRLLVALAAEAELRWIVWGLLQAELSDADFDYHDYAAQRWRCFCTYKEWALTPFLGSLV